VGQPVAVFNSRGVVVHRIASRVRAGSPASAAFEDRRFARDCFMFVFGFFVFARWLPPSKGAPQVGQKAPEFLLMDTTGKSVSLGELLSTPINGNAPKGVLLVFYRGYW
jgi:hypothetical protein